MLFECAAVVKTVPVEGRMMSTPQPSSYVAAAVQFTPRFGAKAWNVDRLARLTEQAFRDGARLVVHPEMATTGYAWLGRAEIAPHVEPIPGPTVQRFAEMARRHGGWIVAGLPEVDPASGGFYNSAALIGPDGVAGKYRKSHAYITEIRWARDGDLGLPVFDTPLGRLGILICMDAEYPEPARVLALAGCDVVCFPTNWLDEKCPSAYWLQRAWENGTYWVCANRVGFERGVQFSGGSAILGPDGEVAAALDDAEGVVLARIELGRAATARERRLAGRRPGLYQAMALNSYLWPGAHAAGRSDSNALDGLGSAPSPAPLRIAIHNGPAGLEDILHQLEYALSRRPADLAAVPPVRPAGTEGTDVGSAAAMIAARFAELIESLGRLAKTRGCVIVTGGPLAEGADLFDAVVLALPDGTVIVHRSTSPGADRAWASPGCEEPPVVRTPLGLVGLLTGDELVIPELGRGLAVSGAEFIVAESALDRPAPTGLAATAVPLASGARDQDPLHWFLPRVRAAENNAWLVFANAGTLPSGIFGPSFYRVPRRESVGSEGPPRINLPADRADTDRRMALEKPYLRMRRCHLYSALTS
jgi:predicted amidohydrolase